MDRLGNTSFTLEPSDDRGYLLTEQTNPNSQNLDLLSTEALVNLFSEEDLQPQRAVRAAIPALVAAIDSITERLQAGGSLYYLGAGTSGRLGVLDAAECPPTFCTQPDLVQGVLAGGEPALLKSSEGLEDLEVAGRDDLASRGFGSDDCLIGIAAGGTTPYVKGGLAYAQSINALTIAMACVPEDQSPLPCSINIRLITGPELLTGSTRLKAGTATKMALNIISTGVMVRLGKVFGNQMIDVSASNSKLVDRALRILVDLAGIDREQGMDLLRLSKGSVKLSLLMVSAGIDVDAARKLLSDHDNQLRLALNSLGCSLSKG
jgi:N-acetylmuramic acid 6-phosphate etherase